jgi:hypothetical protein
MFLKSEQVQTMSKLDGAKATFLARECFRSVSGHRVASRLPKQ